jgi:hypothetical protein
VRLEVPIRTSLASRYLDILIRTDAGQEIGIELKYKTRALNVEVSGESFALLNQAAQDIGRYDFFKDLCRIEDFVNARQKRVGYAIFLTNDSAYWKDPASQSHGYAAFAMNEGRTISGKLCWGESASEGTRKGRQEELAVAGPYCLKWNTYSVLPVKAYNQFRYLCVQAGAA